MTWNHRPAMHWADYANPYDEYEPSNDDPPLPDPFDCEDPLETPAMTDTYTPDAAEQLDTLEGVMHEVMTHIEKALAALNAGLMQTAGPLRESPFADLALARAHLEYCLSAYQPAPEDVKYIQAAPTYTPEALTIQLENAENWYNQHGNDPAYQYSDEERAEMLEEIAELRAETA